MVQRSASINLHANAPLRATTTTRLLRASLAADPVTISDTLAPPTMAANGSTAVTLPAIGAVKNYLETSRGAGTPG
jgi:hypothetical protein